MTFIYSYNKTEMH